VVVGRTVCPPSGIDIARFLALSRVVPTNLPTKLRAEEKKRQRNIFSGSLCFYFFFFALGPVHTPHPPPAERGCAVRVACLPSTYAPKMGPVIPGLGPASGVIFITSGQKEVSRFTPFSCDRNSPSPVLTAPRLRALHRAEHIGSALIRARRYGAGRPVRWSWRLRPARFGSYRSFWMYLPPEQYARFRLRLL